MIKKFFFGLFRLIRQLIVFSICLVVVGGGIWFFYLGNYDPGAIALRQGNHQEAFERYSLQAQRGFVSAQKSLGNIYYYGQGRPQNYVKAHMWYNIAARNGDSEAIVLRQLVAKEMYKRDITAAQELAQECIDRQLNDC